MGYTPSFTPEYENGWEDLPLETTPITADALNNYDEGIGKIEEYLASDNSQANLADAYDETATYDVGDYVIYGGDLYKCTTEISTAEEWDSTHWTACIITEEMATSGGTTVIANPSGQATDTLTKLQVENTIYGISGGGGNANIWTGTQAEYEAQASQIADDTVVLITDDEEHTQAFDIYSTDEQVIGTWVDGSTLYRKSFTTTQALTVSNSTWTDTGFTITNGGIAVKAFAVRNTDTGQAFPVIAYIENGSLKIEVCWSSQLAFPTGSIITLEYTKTTD